MDRTLFIRLYDLYVYCMGKFFVSIPYISTMLLIKTSYSLTYFIRYCSYFSYSYHGADYRWSCTQSSKETVEKNSQGHQRNCLCPNPSPGTTRFLRGHSTSKPEGFRSDSRTRGNIHLPPIRILFLCQPIGSSFHIYPKHPQISRKDRTPWHPHSYWKLAIVVTILSSTAHHSSNLILINLLLRPPLLNCLVQFLSLRVQAIHLQMILQGRYNSIQSTDPIPYCWPLDGHRQP